MRDIEGQICWVYCDDLESTCRFYGEILGFELWRDAGAARIYHTINGAFIGVCRAFDDRKVQPNGGMITLLTNDVDGWYALLKARNVRLQGAPQVLSDFGIYSFFCEDPNGYVIEFQKFL